jgi:hypothetical protein
MNQANSGEVLGLKLSFESLFMEFSTLAHDEAAKPHFQNLAAIY